MKSSGALPSQLIDQISRLGQITLGGKPVLDKNIKPASYDLTIGLRGWCVKSTFLPREREQAQAVIEQYSLYQFSLDEPVVLNQGSVYVLELQEEFNLDEDIWALVSPKSSSGRINLWVRTLADGFPRFDRLPSGYKGKLYAIVSAKSWPVKIKAGDSITQIRFFRGHDSRLGNFELQLINREVGLLFAPSGKLIEGDGIIYDEGILLTADLRGKIIAYQAKHTSELLDLSGIGKHDREKFFTPILGNNQEELVLNKGEFYIVPSYEYLRVPPDLAAEMIAYDIAAGEFRSHYAGFFDPGFGFGKKGTIFGTPAVLEIVPHEDVILRHRQPVCKMVYERLLANPDRVYGSDIRSNYHNQRGPQLAKYFV